MARGQFATGQGERMATLFIGQAQVATGLLPLGTMRIDMPAAGAMMRDQMRELVP